jgi:hypothetical protein
VLSNCAVGEERDLKKSTEIVKEPVIPHVARSWYFAYIVYSKYPDIRRG